MSKPLIDTRREAIVAEFAAVNDQLTKLKARATQLHQELGALKNGASNKPSPPKPAPPPPKKTLSPANVSRRRKMMLSCTGVSD